MDVYVWANDGADELVDRTVEVHNGLNGTMVNVDFDQQGKLIGVEIVNAGQVDKTDR